MKNFTNSQSRLLLFLCLTCTCFSCTKDSALKDIPPTNGPEKIVNHPSYNGPVLTFTNSNTTSIFKHKGNSQFQWTYNDGATGLFFDQADITIEEAPILNIQSLTNSQITMEVESKSLSGNNLSMKDVSVSNNILAAKLYKNGLFFSNITISNVFFISLITEDNSICNNKNFPVGRYAMNSLGEIVKLDGSSSGQPSYIAPALLWMAACLIQSIADEYCSRKIQKEVAGCTKSGFCSSVGICQARCVSCN